MFSRKLKKRSTNFITWSHKETKTSRKDSWVLRSRVVVIFPLQVITVVLKANRHDKLLGVALTSVIHHAIQIYVGKKDNANQWKVTVLEEFLHAVLLYR